MKPLIKVIALLVSFLLLLGVLLSPFLGERYDYRLAYCQTNLKAITVALNNYYDRYGTLPPPVVYDHSGRRMHSWRVLLLPELHYTDLYEEYDFEEPWNGPKNSRLVTRIPNDYRCPSSRIPNHGTTSYLAIVNSNSEWMFGQRSGGMTSLPLLLETDRSVPWTEPVDFVVDDAAGVAQISKRHDGGVNIAFWDGNVSLVDSTATLGHLFGFLKSDKASQKASYDKQ